MAENSEPANPTAAPTDDTIDQSEPISDITESADQSDQSESSHSVPSYLLGYGSTFVYNQAQPEVNSAQNQAASYSETTNQSESSYSNSQSDVSDVVSGSGDSEGSGGSSYQPTPQTPSNTPQNTPPRVSSLSCWRCENALTWAECASSGHLERCEESADSCQLTVRKRDGNYESITTGCKQKQACENNKRKV